MYQYSLSYYTTLFNRCIAEAEKSQNLETRLANIISYATLVIFQNICRGLFERDKLLFSSSICFQVRGRIRGSGRDRASYKTILLQFALHCTLHLPPTHTN